MENGVEGVGGNLGWKMGELVEEMEGSRDDIRQHRGVRALRRAACYGATEPDGKFHYQLQGAVARASGTLRASCFVAARPRAGHPVRSQDHCRKPDKSLGDTRVCHGTPSFP